MSQDISVLAYARFLFRPDFPLLHSWLQLRPPYYRKQTLLSKELILEFISWTPSALSSIHLNYLFRYLENWLGSLSREQQQELLQYLGANPDTKARLITAFDSFLTQAFSPCIPAPGSSSSIDSAPSTKLLSPSKPQSPLPSAMSSETESRKSSKVSLKMRLFGTCS